MKKVMASFAALLACLCGTAWAQAHRTATAAVSTTTVEILQRVPTLTVAARLTLPDREPPLLTPMVALLIIRRDLEKRLPLTDMGSATHTAGQGTSASNAYGAPRIMRKVLEKRLPLTAYGSATHYAGDGTVATNSSGRQPMLTAHPLRTTRTIRLRLSPTTEQRATTAPRGRRRGPRAAVVGVVVGAAAASSKANSESSSAYNAGYSAGANSNTANANAAAANANAAAANANAAAANASVAAAHASAPPQLSTARIRWAEFMRRYLRAASARMYRVVGPTICAETPGSALPTARMG